MRQQVTCEEMTTENIYVTKPLLPKIDELIEGIKEIYERGVVTNSGPVHQQLESDLHARLGGTEFVLFNNGTSALLAALASLDLPKGSEVITTPFTFAATSHVISILGLVPVFVDIDPKYMTIDVNAIEAKLTEKTRCVLAVHVYGYPCDVYALDNLAKKHDLKLVYDAAHAFGVQVDGRPIGSFGDATAYSFHATKLFNSVEGGGLSLSNSVLAQAAKDFRNFGIRSEDVVAAVGINGKMSELHALFGHLNLRMVDEQVEARKKVAAIYNEILSCQPEIIIEQLPSNVVGSYQYFPVRIRQFRDFVYEGLKRENIFARKYFYPLVTDFECYRDAHKSSDVPHAVVAAQEVLCLPFYGELYEHDVERIAKRIVQLLKEARAYQL
ncbi:dTDP-4-amino-4,6-dideoxy-D-glucose transaminase [Pseudomonas zeae]